MKVAAILLCSLCAVLAEPPVPGNQYLPANNGPSPNYGAPNGNGGYPGGNGNGGYPGGNGNGNGNGGRPNNQYGPPQKPNNQYGPPSTGYGAPNGGGKNGNGDDESEPASYQFEYMVKDDESGNDFGHMEQREGDVAQGKYYVLLPDGRKQIVEYTADTDGYHPKVSYEEGAGGAGGYQNGGYPSNGGKNGGNGGYPSGNGNGGGNGGYNY